MSENGTKPEKRLKIDENSPISRTGRPDLEFSDHYSDYCAICGNRITGNEQTMVLDIKIGPIERYKGTKWSKYAKMCARCADYAKKVLENTLEGVIS